LRQHARCWPKNEAGTTVPATTNLLGVKGCGEAGCAGSMTSVMNAVVDVLSEVGIAHFDMPASPPRVWAAIRKANSGSES
jgi:carbon-monoxide dehydrogenase large subunit